MGHSAINCDEAWKDAGSWFRMEMEIQRDRRHSSPTKKSKVSPHEVATDKIHLKPPTCSSVREGGLVLTEAPGSSSSGTYASSTSSSSSDDRPKGQKRVMLTPASSQPPRPPASAPPPPPPPPPPSDPKPVLDYVVVTTFYTKEEGTMQVRRLPDGSLKTVPADAEWNRQVYATQERPGMSTVTPWPVDDSGRVHQVEPWQ